MRAFASRAAELLPLWIVASSLRRSSALSRTTYRFTEAARAAIISSIAPIAMDNELLNPCEIVEASHKDVGVALLGVLLGVKASAGPGHHMARVVNDHLDDEATEGRALHRRGYGPKHKIPDSPRVARHALHVLNSTPRARL